MMHNRHTRHQLTISENVLCAGFALALVGILSLAVWLCATAWDSEPMHTERQTMEAIQ